MAGIVDIQPPELRAMADQIGLQRNALNDRFSDIKKQIDNLRNDGWRDANGEELRDKFNRLHVDYLNKYPPAMQNYINFLNKTADDYERDAGTSRNEINSLADKII